MGRGVNVAGGKRPDLNGVFFRSAWEANYARYLNFLVRHGNIQSWKYETREFEFPVKRGTRFYKPDFQVVDNNGNIEWHEVKGWMDKKSQTQMKRMAKYFPSEKITIIDEPAYRALARDVAGLVPHWE